MRQIIVAMLLALLGTNAYAQGSSPSNIAREYVIGEGQGLRVVAWIKDEATLADDDWFRLEINNSGPNLVVRSARLVAPGQYGTNGPRDLIGTLPLDVPANGRVGPFDTFLLPAGQFKTSVPGTFIALHIGPRNFGMTVTMQLAFTAVLTSGDVITFTNPASITFRWLAPATEHLGELRRQTSVLLRTAFEASNRWSLARQVRLSTLLGVPEIWRSIAIEDVLVAAGRRQSLRRFELSELVVIMFQRWQTEPKIVEFFKEALRERGSGAVADLSMIAQPPWDDSLLEPIISLVERTSLEQSLKPWEEDMTISRALDYLDRTHAHWSQGPSSASRLSAAVLRHSPAPEPGGMYGWSQTLALTHDRALIKILRPYLDDSTLDHFTSNSSNMPFGATPMRYSELAANAICRLLGEPILFSTWDRAKAPRGGPYPEWKEWDKKLEALRQRLDAMKR